MENWKTIDDAPNYEISDHGNVRRSVQPKRGPYAKRPVPYPIKTYIQPKIRGGGKKRRSGGYEYVCLQGPTGEISRQVHRLVMHAFHGPSELQVNHINGIKTDNRLENLEYCTPSQNRWHAKNALDSYTYGEDHHNSKLNTAQVEAIHLLVANNWTYEKIGKVVGCTGTNVSYIARGKAWSHKDPTPKSP